MDERVLYQKTIDLQADVTRLQARERELLEANNRMEQQARDARAALRGGFQDRVGLWADACFSQEVGLDPVERNHRFLEEALELVQACGCTSSEAHQLVDYVFGRPVGEKMQEAGGAIGTLALLCRAQGIDLAIAAETELTRCWGKIDKIRAKQAAKPKHGPLPTFVVGDHVRAMRGNGSFGWDGEIRQALASSYYVVPFGTNKTGAWFEANEVREITP